MIRFHNQDIKFSIKDKAMLKQWITGVVQAKGRKTGDISFVFCSDEGLLNINMKYLDHNTYTDIITFDYSEGGNQSISGDIFISTERVAENAKKFSKSFENELHRVMIHGVLHLLGYKDKTKSAKAEMTRQEDLSLSVLKKMI